MMHYTLRCAQEHRFDGWFGSSASFDRQRDGGLVVCPVCGSTDVDRALMAPALVGTALEANAPSTTPSHDGEPSGAPSSTAAEERASAPVALMDEGAAKLRSLIRAVHAAVREHGVDVGRAFPQEARRIHYGEAEPRGIYGEARPEEARELIEEGIAVLPIPPLPEERN